MPKNKPTNKPIFNADSISLFEQAILNQTSKIKAKKIAENTISYKEIASNFPLVKAAIFIHNVFDSKTEDEILNMVYNSLAFSNVKVFIVDQTIVKMSSLKNCLNKNNKQIIYSENNDLDLNIIKHVMDTTQPEISILFTKEKIETNSLLSFQIKKKELLFNSQCNTPIEEQQSETQEVEEFL